MFYDSNRYRGRDQPTYDRVILSDWAKRKLSTLQSMLQEKQFARDAKFFGSRYDTTKFSRTILYRLANDVFGYNGWSTSIQSCLLQELPVEDEGRHSARCVVEIRLILKDNTFKDATGVADSSTCRTSTCATRQQRRSGH
ncbi:DNA repair and recombination protein rti1 [Candida viswanathii]|uniref:DNA repair and recombination protein RAD52 n=1 Tax=Candida viswanathii TaxID=5486 RepID=A0A367XSZ3_9ASCO|nr:DNA repair and recombination protein rti1 [Candida viswanathii]